MKFILIILTSLSLTYAFKSSDQIEVATIGTPAALIASKTNVKISDNFSLGLKMTPYILSKIDHHYDFYYDRPNESETKTTIGTGAGLTTDYMVGKLNFSASVSYVFPLNRTPYIVSSFSGQYAFTERWHAGISINHHYCNSVIGGNTPDMKEYYRFDNPYSANVFLSHSVDETKKYQKVIHRIISLSGILGIIIFGPIILFSYGQ